MRTFFRVVACLGATLFVGAVTLSCAGASPSAVVVSYSASPVQVRSSSTSTPVKASATPTVLEARRPETPEPATIASVTPDADDAEDENTAVESPAAGVSSTVVAESRSPVVTGQVAEAQVLFVTSSSHTSRYYYAREDNGWHRIQSSHRIWFGAEDDLKKAFPGRVLHPIRVARVTQTPTPTTPL